MYLLVALQLLNKRALVKKGLQSLLSVVVTELLEGSTSLHPRLPGILGTWSVYNQQRTQRVLLRGLQSSKRDKVKHGICKGAFIKVNIQTETTLLMYHDLILADLSFLVTVLTVSHHFQW